MAASSVTGTGNGSAEKAFSKILNGVVKSENLAKGALTSSGTIFKTTVTGNGSAQSTPHGLDCVPSVVMIYSNNDSVTITEGTHTNENIVCTVTNTKVYHIVAMA